MGVVMANITSLLTDEAATILSLFYLVSPNNSCYSKLEQVPQYIEKVIMDIVYIIMLLSL